MRRLVLTTAVVLALASVGVAAAHVLSAKSGKSVTATFTATTVSGSRSLTCTNANGSFSDMTATYAGTATSSDPSLNGPIRLALHTLISTSSGVGMVTGKLAIDTRSPKGTVAHLVAVYSNGAIAGFATGHPPDPLKHLFANVSASFNPTTGLTNGKIGSSEGGAAVEITAQPCRAATAKHKH